ncbi:MAG TPA: hypothetical protein VJP84_16400 [Steroidobacteraceae bacterium]|nr:hypothetical protein [Steroidobacteraceae bacterium]
MPSERSRPTGWSGRAGGSGAGQGPFAPRDFRSHVQVNFYRAPRE